MDRLCILIKFSNLNFVFLSVLQLRGVGKNVNIVVMITCSYCGVLCGHQLLDSWLETLSSSSSLINRAIQSFQNSITYRASLFIYL